MRLPIRREELLRLLRFVAVAEGALLLVALVLGVIHWGVTRGRFLDSFLLMTFVLFVLLLFLAVLSGPGAFLARPKLAALGPEAQARWREWLAAPRVGRDQEFFDLVLYTSIGFLLLLIATGIGAVLQAFGG